MQHTGCKGVMSANALLEDPALFWPQGLTHESEHSIDLTHQSRFKSGGLASCINPE